MNCQRYREAVSALLDGEDPGISAELVDRHLAACGRCRAWRDTASAFARSARLAPAEDVPDLTRSILLSAADTAIARGRRRVRLPRIALVVIALAQLAISVADLAADGAAPHSVRELGSWDLALAVGFLFAAWRPARAWGMVPLVAAIVSLLLVSSGIDLLSGRALPTSETAHVLEVAGMVLLWLLARAYGADGGTPSRLTGPSAGTGPEAAPAGRVRRRRGDGSRPAAVGRRIA